jgi:hypothetical protein
MRERDKLLLLMEAAPASGVEPVAMRDAMRRGLQAFEESDLDAITARQWAERLRQDAPHFFPQPEAASPAPALDPRHARRPQPVALTPEQARILQGLPPTKRLTQYRVLQERVRTGAQR